jgi:glycosyltransferase involved in cell wall biosynthesis
MTISVTIPTYNRNDDLNECLKSIRENSRYENEIIVLHPFCDEDVTEICNKYNAKLIPDGSREDGKRVKSLWAIINNGIEIAESQYVCWLNDDCVVLKDWDFYALEYFKNDKDIALVVLKTKGIGESEDFMIMRISFGIPCANYGVLDKNTGIRFDENLSWFHGDSDISMQTVIIYNKKVVGTEESCLIHNHRHDENRKSNELDPRVLADEFFYRKKWGKYKLVNGRIKKKNIAEIFFPWFRNKIRQFIRVRVLRRKDR